MPGTDRRGFSLLEAVVAMTIVGLVSASALAMGSSQLRLAARSREAIEVEAMAGSRLDYLGLLTDAELLSLPDSVAKGTFDWPLNQYTWEITSDPSNDQPGIYYVTIRILYPGNAYTVQTAFYRRPLTVTSGG